MSVKIKTRVNVVAASAVYLFMAMGEACAANKPVPGCDPDTFRDQSTPQIMINSQRLC